MNLFTFVFVWCEKRLKTTENLEFYRMLSLESETTSLSSCLGLFVFFFSAANKTYVGRKGSLCDTASSRVTSDKADIIAAPLNKKWSRTAACSQINYK